VIKSTKQEEEEEEEEEEAINNQQSRTVYDNSLLPQLPSQSLREEYRTDERTREPGNKNKKERDEKQQRRGEGEERRELHSNSKRI